MRFEKFGVPKECFEQYGQDLDGCSTQENEGCSRCRLFNGNDNERLKDLIYESLVKAGFDKTQASYLTSEILKGGLKNGKN